MNKVKTMFLVFGTILSMLSLLGCASAFRYEGAYKGKVVDADTGEPIEGVVVLGSWSREYPTPAGAVHRFYDARETVTDKNGDFSIPGMGLLIFSNIMPMDILIFKAGYDYESGSWESLKNSLFLSKKIKWGGDKAIIPLRKLTIEERMKILGPPSPPDEAQKEKIRLILQEINKDRVEQGLNPINVGKEN